MAEVRTPLYAASFAGDGSVTAWTIEFRGAKRLVVGGRSARSLSPSSIRERRRSLWRFFRTVRGWRSPTQNRPAP